MIDLGKCDPERNTRDLWNLDETNKNTNLNIHEQEQ